MFVENHQQRGIDRCPHEHSTTIQQSILMHLLQMIRQTIHHQKVLSEIRDLLRMMRSMQPPLKARFVVRDSPTHRM